MNKQTRREFLKTVGLAAASAGAVSVVPGCKKTTETTEVKTHKGGGIGNTQDYWGNDYFDDSYFRNGKPEKFEGYCTDVWFAEAMKFIEVNKDRPFFCYLPTNAPHGPYRVPGKYSEPYKGKGVKFNFYGMITNIDENMGRLMNKLKELGIEDNTILIFMTDNGTSGGRFSVGMRGRKGSEYDGGHRVPCFVRWPSGGIEAGTDIDRITAHIDLLPTLVELCALEKKPNSVRLDGASLVPLLKAQDKAWPQRTLITDSQRVDYPIKWRKSAVMTDRWRLVNGKELYDMTVDPGQKNNVVDEHQEIVAKLRDEYNKWWAGTSKRFLEHCEVIVGSDEENPAKLTSHDWHAHGPWNQDQVRQGQKRNSYWAVEVARDGDYEIALRRWPKEVDAPITGTIPGGKAISATTARLKIADVDETKPVPKDAKAVTFEMKLKAGKTRLQTWFTDEGESRGAYYVYVKRLG